MPKVKTTKIFGGPGTGKTTALIGIVEKELKEYSLDDIGFVSYTKNATREARKRAISQLGVERKAIPYFGTIHSICFHLNEMKREFVVGEKHYKEFCNRMRVPYESTKEKCDLEDEESLTAGVVTEKSPEANIIFRFYNELRNIHCVDISDVTTDGFRKMWAMSDVSEIKSITSFVNDPYEFLVAWKEYKDNKGLYDFGDMLFYTLKAGAKVPVRVLIVDEYQDITPLQSRILGLWADDMEKMFVAGDDDQTINEYAGADAGFLLNLVADEEIVLKTTYRLPEVVRRFSMAYISRNEHRKEKKIKSLKGGGSIRMYWCIPSLMPEVCRLIDIERKTYILFRTNHMARAFIRKGIEMMGIPYKNTKGGGPFSDRAVSFFNAAFKLSSNIPITDEEVIAVVKNVPQKGFLKRGLKARLPKTLGKGNFDYKRLRAMGFEQKLLHQSRNKMLEISKLNKNSIRALKGMKHERIGEIKTFVGTIHSVKGGEAENVIVCTDLPPVVSRGMGKTENVEAERRVFYTAQTRAEQNLIFLSNLFYNYDTRTVNEEIAGLCRKFGVEIISMQLDFGGRR